MIILHLTFTFLLLRRREREREKHVPQAGGQILSWFLWSVGLAESPLHYWLTARWCQGHARWCLGSQPPGEDCHPLEGSSPQDVGLGRECNSTLHGSHLQVNKLRPREAKWNCGRAGHQIILGLVMILEAGQCPVPNAGRVHLEMGSLSSHCLAAHHARRTWLSPCSSVFPLGTQAQSHGAGQEP